MNLLHLDGNIAFCLATGSMTNRCEASTARETKVRDGDERISNNNNWFERGCYNSVRRMNKRASLLADLEYLFIAGLQRDNVEKGGANKYTPLEAVTYLLNLKLPDGRRKYSHDEENKNGPPPTLKYVKNWFSRRAKQGAEYTNDMAVGKNEETNDYGNMSLSNLKKLARSRFGMKKITRKQLVMLLLELYYELENMPDFKSLVSEKGNDLEEQCNELKLCYNENNKNTYIQLFELKDRVEVMKNNDDNDNSYIDNEDEV